MKIPGTRRKAPAGDGHSPVKELNRPFVLQGSGTRRENAEIPSLPSLRIFFANGVDTALSKVYGSFLKGVRLYLFIFSTGHSNALTPFSKIGYSPL